MAVDRGRVRGPRLPVVEGPRPWPVLVVVCWAAIVAVGLVGTAVEHSAGSAVAAATTLAIGGVPLLLLRLPPARHWLASVPRLPVILPPRSSCAGGPSSPCGPTSSKPTACPPGACRWVTLSDPVFFDKALERAVRLAGAGRDTAAATSGT